MEGARRIINELKIVGNFKNVVVVDSFKNEIRIDQM